MNPTRIPQEVSPTARSKPGQKKYKRVILYSILYNERIHIAVVAYGVWSHLSLENKQSAR